MSCTQHDVFISHASEDKDAFVRPLAIALRNLGVAVWFDEFSLRVGDSLSCSIDKGLAGSRYGVVVISPAFISKHWPQRELSGLVAKTVDAEDRKVILPIWHGIRRDQVLAFSPPLADAIALNTQILDAAQISLRLLEVIRPDLHNGRPVEELRCIADGDAMEELRRAIEEARTELEGVKEKLSAFQCPICGSDLERCVDVPVNHEYRSDYLLERYECGYETHDDYMNHPCPYQPDYPNPDDYELSCTEVDSGQWMCFAKPKTPMAERVDVWRGWGETREEAEADVRQRLPRRRTDKPRGSDA